MNTGDLLDRIKQIQLREYGYTDDWRELRGLESNDVRVRGVIAQELRQVFPEHVEILDELIVKQGIKLTDFHQVDKQGLVMDVIGAFQAHTANFITHQKSLDSASSELQCHFFRLFRVRVYTLVNTVNRVVTTIPLDTVNNQPLLSQNNYKL